MGMTTKGICQVLTVLTVLGIVLPSAMASTVEFSTFMGGSSYDDAKFVALDNAGDIYVAGHTLSPEFPVSAGAFDETHNGSWDLFLQKFDGSTRELLWSTVIGGTSRDECYSLAMTDDGYGILTGRTWSANFPVTAGAFDQSHNGGEDGFILKFSALDGYPVWSTFLGGSAADGVYMAAADEFGDLFLAGHTFSSNLPASAGAFDTTLNGGRDGFIAKFSGTGSELLWLSYLGGSSTDQIHEITFAGDGNIIVDGSTLSTNYPTTSGAFDTTHNGSSDAFVTKFSADEPQMIWSTFIGGSAHESGECHAVTADGNIIVTGRTTSIDLPASQGAYDESFNGAYDVYVACLEESGAALLWLTFFGGAGSEYPVSGVKIWNDWLVVAGFTSSADLPMAGESYDDTFNGGDDCYAAFLNLSGTELGWSTYLGGSSQDHAELALDLDEAGNIYLAGSTVSSDFPTTPGAFDATHNGGEDAFVTVLGSPFGCFAGIEGHATLSCDGATNDNVGVTISLYDGSTGEYLDATYTDEQGHYGFPELCSGEYLLTPITPLSQFFSQEEILVSLPTGNGISTVDMSFECIDIVAQPRGKGFWKHQFGVALKGRGQAHIDEAQLCEFLDQIGLHFNDNALNQVVVYEPPLDGNCQDRLSVASALLHLRGNVGMRDKARQHLMVSLLNAAAGYISLSEIISEDGATLTQAITYCDNLIDDLGGDHEVAKDIAERINCGRLVASGVIPLDTDQIAYRQPVAGAGLMPTLGQNHPNPFNPESTIWFELPRAQTIKLDVFALNGRHVASLISGQLSAGRHQATWRGLDDHGQSVPSGMYLYRLEAGGFYETKQMMLIK